MKVSHKLGIFAALIVAGIVLFCFLWLDNVAIQIGLLAINITIMLIRLGLKKFLSEMILLLPFLLSLALIYGILAGFQIGYPAAYWLNFGITRSALLLSSMFFMQFMLAWISIEEIQELPLNINTLKYIILGNLLYKEAVSAFANIELYMRMIPSEQYGKRNYISKLRSKLSCLLALLAYIISLAALKGEMIDNRIYNCSQGDLK